ncbi:MAG: hypothetical protein AUJ97_06480 [Bacteroidetes bacterium CG2_30_32_10]|nr:MAG: hypothetical protein AUJ97_06480 [Bacteroidetes bacterium CG2_30_32_10]
MNNSFISHSGIVQKINEDIVEVMIVSESACSACKSKKVCSISEMKEKIISVKSDHQIFKIGDKVNVMMEEKIGTYAILFAYVIPFVIMISILIFGYYDKMSEPMMGISVIAFLVLYYLIIYLLRAQFDKKIIFKLEKQNIEID